MKYMSLFFVPLVILFSVSYVNAGKGGVPSPRQAQKGKVIKQKNEKCIPEQKKQSSAKQVRRELQKKCSDDLREYYADKKGK